MNFLTPERKYVGRACFAVVLLFPAPSLSRQLGHREKKDQEREEVAIHTDCHSRGEGAWSRISRQQRKNGPLQFIPSKSDPFNVSLFFYSVQWHLSKWEIEKYYCIQN